jgi:hypothetical protein
MLMKVDSLFIAIGALRAAAVVMRLAAEALDDTDNDEAVEHAAEMRGAVRQVKTWIEGLEQEERDVPSKE